MKEQNEMFSLPRLSWSSFSRSETSSNLASTTLPSVEIHNIETSTQKRSRTLKHLLKANHANHSVLYNNLHFHNHTPHILGSAYLLGGTSEHLNDVYEKEAEHLDPWRDAPGEITKDDWRAFLGKKEYQRAFVDFFEDQLVTKRYDLKELLDEFLLGGKEPLVSGLFSGLAHPLIHLAYAYELQSQSVAIEALALGACCYSFLHKYVDDPKYNRPGPHFTTANGFSLLNILDKVGHDERFEGLYDHPSGDVSKVFEMCEEALLEYWNSWTVDDPGKQLRDVQTTAVSLLLGTPAPSDDSKFGFLFVHVLTSSHAIRVLLPLLPGHFHASLLRQWWLFTLAVYVAQTRPQITFRETNCVYDCQGKDWRYAVNKALSGPHAKDAHYVKAIRAMKVADETWEGEFWLKAATKFADSFEFWRGSHSAEDEVTAEN